MTGKMPIQCNLVLDHPDLKIVNILAPDFYSSGLYRMEWPSRVLWLLTSTWPLWNDRVTRESLSEILAVPSERQSVCILVNELKDIEAAREISGIEVEYVNHNALASTRQFTITGGEKIYDAAVNARPIHLKRVHLCSKIESLCCIRKMDAIDPTDYFDAATLKPKFINHETLTVRRVVQLLNQSHCGVMLSAREGACHASTEYLYCGLPVVSTACDGGRQIWYDSDNSVIVEPDEDAVREGVEYLKGRLLEGSISPAKIRESALNLRDRFLGTLRQLISRHLAESGLSEKVSVDRVMQGWLAEIDLAGRQMKLFPSAEEAAAYLNSGNLAFWQRALKRPAAGN